VISVVVTLSGGFTDADIEEAREYVSGATGGGEAKVTRFLLNPHEVMIGAAGPGQRRERAARERTPGA